jgi:FKBP-type peptidyl-prolyl cis-trans isomerase FkpA
MFKQIVKLTLAAAIMAGAVACNQGGSEVKLKGGMTMTIHEKKTKDTAMLGMVMSFHSVTRAKTKGKDTVLSDTYKSDNPSVIQIGDPSMGGFADAFQKLSVGDSAVISLLADSLPQRPEFIDKGSKFTISVKVLKLQTQQQFEKEMQAKMENDAKKQKGTDDKAIQDYLAKNNIKAEKSESGLYYQVMDPGTGAALNVGDSVSLHYTGTFLDGKVFDSSRESGKPFTIAAGTGGVVPGFDEGVMKLKQGGKAKLFIPSALAYGAQGGGPIPPNSVLIFDIEAVKVKANKPQ